MPEPPPLGHSLEKAHVAIGALRNRNAALAEILDHARDAPSPADERKVLRYTLDTFPVCSLPCVFPGFIGPQPNVNDGWRHRLDIRHERLNFYLLGTPTHSPIR